MVALASRPVAAPTQRPTASRRAWLIAAGGVLLAGVSLRLVLGGGGVGDRSAVVMGALLGGVVWIAALLLSGPRRGLMSTLASMLLLNLAALPARNAPEFDEREALFTTEQALSGRLAIPASESLILTALVEPIYTGAQPAFGLAGDVGGTALSWHCPWQPGRQWLALPMPPQAGSVVDVRLRLSGRPSRDADYLLVYSSAVRGGPLLALVAPADVPRDARRCSVA